jgi:hypothetical protein
MPRRQSLGELGVDSLSNLARFWPSRADFSGSTEARVGPLSWWCALHPLARCKLPSIFALRCGLRPIGRQRPSS